MSRMTIMSMKESVRTTQAHTCRKILGFLCTPRADIFYKNVFNTLCLAKWLFFL